MKFTGEISVKIRTAIKVKLAELGNDVYEELPDYIMVMVANRRSEEQMGEDLSLFLGDNTQQFTSWLHCLLSKLQSVASVSSSEERRASGSAVPGKAPAHLQARAAETGTSADDQARSDERRVSEPSERSRDEDASSAMPPRCSDGASNDVRTTTSTKGEEKLPTDSQKDDCCSSPDNQKSNTNASDSAASVDLKSDTLSVDLKSDGKRDVSSVDLKKSDGKSDASSVDQKSDSKSDSLPVDHADSTCRDRSVNEPSITCDTDNLDSEKSKTDSATTPENQKVSMKRKKHSVTRVFRVKSRKFESESDSAKSDIVSSSKAAAEQGTDASDSEKETKSYTHIRKMKQSNGSEVTSSVSKTDVVGNENGAEVKENISEDNFDHGVDREKLKEGPSKLQQL